MRELALVAELGQTDRGDVLSIEKSIVEFAAAGATDIKLQLLRPDTIAGADSLPYWRTDLGSQREAFDEWGWIDYTAPDGMSTLRYLETVAIDYGVGLHATAFDYPAVEVCDEMRWPIKIASGDITNKQLVRSVGAASRSPLVILSTGAATLDEVYTAVEWLNRPPDQVVVLACTLIYPCPPGQANLRRISTLREALPRHRIGYSDHTESYSTAASAVALGASWLEKHCARKVTIVPDSKMGLSPSAFRIYADTAHGELVDHSTPDKTLMGDGVLGGEAEAAARVGAYRSWHATKPIPAGTVILPGHVTMLRPCPEGAVPASVLPVDASAVALVDIDPGDIIMSSMIDTEAT